MRGKATFAEQPLSAGGASPTVAYLGGELRRTRISLPRATRRAGPRLLTRRPGSPTTALAGMVGTCGWWSRRQAAGGGIQWLPFKTTAMPQRPMAAGAESDAGEAFVKATCAPLALLLSAGFSTAMDGGRRAIFQATGHRWPSTSSDDNLR